MVCLWVLLWTLLIKKKITFFSSETSSNANFHEKKNFKKISLGLNACLHVLSFG